MNQPSIRFVLLEERAYKLQPCVPPPTHTHTHTHAHTHTYTHICTHTHTHIRAHTHTHRWNSMFRMPCQKEGRWWWVGAGPFLLEDAFSNPLC